MWFSWVKTTCNSRSIARNSNTEHIAPSAYLPEEDALTAVVCGSRSPIPAPGRAEACILIQAGEKIFIFDTGGGSIENLNKWNTPWTRVEAVLYSLTF